jgi:hypothetical protein
MTTRLRPEQEAAIEEFLRTRQHIEGPESVLRVSYVAHVSALLAEIDALREELDDTRVALGLERVDNAIKTALWETAIKDMAQLRKQLEDAQAPLVWSDELPTKKGRYWVREGGFPETIADVGEDAGGRVRVIWASGHSSLVSDALHCQWAGPISPPQEP